MPDPLFARRWVHLFEQDTAAGAVYVPDAASLPLSRRPREQVAFHEDGTATVASGAPDDRLAAQPACWRTAGGPAPAGAGPLITILERQPDRLVLRIDAREDHGEA